MAAVCETLQQVQSDDSEAGALDDLLGLGGALADVADASDDDDADALVDDAFARRARGAMRPAANEKRRTKNRADEVIERRRRVEREMRSQMVEREVEKEVESLVKKRVRANAANDLIDFLCIDFDACDGLID